MTETEQDAHKFAHQIGGFAMGIIACAWFVGATSEQVWLIRLPATIVLTAYSAWLAWRYIKRNFART